MHNYGVNSFRDRWQCLFNPLSISVECAEHGALPKRLGVLQSGRRDLKQAKKELNHQ